MIKWHIIYKSKRVNKSKAKFKFILILLIVKTARFLLD